MSYYRRDHDHHDYDLTVFWLSWSGLISELNLKWINFLHGHVLQFFCRIIKFLELQKNINTYSPSHLKSCTGFFFWHEKNRLSKITIMMSIIRWAHLYHLCQEEDRIAIFSNKKGSKQRYKHKSLSISHFKSNCCYLSTSFCCYCCLLYMFTCSVLNMRKIESRKVKQ